VRIVIFCHSLVSDWNHGNAHFLRGVTQELLARSVDVRIFEPANGWSAANLIHDHGTTAVEAFHRAYPHLRSEPYDPASLDVWEAIAGADLVLVHEWTEPDLVARIGAHRAAHGSYVLLFHDTHHRSVTDPASMAAYDLSHYDGVLAFGDSVRDRYLERGWTARAWTWHEAADTRMFYPRTPGSTAEHAESAERGNDPSASAATGTSETIRSAGSARSAVDRAGDVVWIGNWGDEERTAELDEFLFTPVKRLGLRAAVYGVRYPSAARARLAADGIEYRGWLPNPEVPNVFAQFALTVHIPRRPYLESLPGIPTIRPFEALACGIPLISARWDKAAGLFTPGRDFLVARDGDEMTRQMDRLLSDPSLGTELAAHGLATVRAKHTCRHRVDELMSIYDQLARGLANAGDHGRMDNLEAVTR
jgi:spore maturation protein CgeB